MSIATLRKTFLKALKEENHDLILKCLETIDTPEHVHESIEWHDEARPVLRRIEDRWPSPPRDSRWQEPIVNEWIK